MTEKEIQQLLLQVKKEIGKPYQVVVSEPIENTIITSLTNFLRNGPKRKVFLIFCDGGDYDYDPDMTQDIEIGMDINNNEHFKITLKIATEVLGPPAKEQLPENMDNRVYTVNHEDVSKEGMKFDNELWTPEYEGGALYKGEYTGETRYWETNNEFIFLESAAYLGDGDFAYYTLITITPKKAQV